MRTLSVCCLATLVVAVSLAGQSIRFRLHAIPQGHLQAIARVDPGNRVAETNERNNDLRVEIAARPPTAELAPLDDVDVWVVPKPPAAA